MNAAALISLFAAVVLGVSASAANLPLSMPVSSAAASSPASSSSVSMASANPVDVALRFRNLCEATGKSALAVTGDKLARLAVIMSRHSVNSAFVHLNEFNLDGFAWIATISGEGEHKTVSLTLVSGVELAKKAYKLPILCEVERSAFELQDVPALRAFRDSTSAMAALSGVDLEDTLSSLKAKRGSMIGGSFGLSAPIYNPYGAKSSRYGGDDEKSASPFGLESTMSFAGEESASSGRKGPFRMVFGKVNTKSDVRPSLVMRYDGHVEDFRTVHGSYAPVEHTAETRVGEIVRDGSMTMTTGTKNGGKSFVFGSPIGASILKPSHVMLRDANHTEKL